ncbi:MAG: HAMP domain-containing histidine kinase [Rhodothermaceae bacterium]|nr:HAMP domain-containing histidine kinase [Rhodothermaceae bacterium]
MLRPLDATLAEEMRGTREAFIRATWTVSGLAALLALLLGALFTWRLVTPLRRMTRRVETLGAGDYAGRLPEAGRDELGRLSSAINDMAAQVEASIDALRTTDRMRRELVANVGHDLRTPLAALHGYLDEAARFASEGREAEAAEAVAVARRQSQQMARLVADLFELSKLEQAAMDEGVAPLQRGPVPLAELLQDAARSHRHAFVEAGIAFEVELPAGLPVIHADGARLLRVLDNLLANARRHTPEGGTVRLHAEVSDATVRVHVTDTGEGIAPEVLPSVFERYYQGTSARTRSAEGGGTGLGLAISRAIARAHGGDLTAESMIGQGSTFTLMLPINLAA